MMEIAQERINEAIERIAQRIIKYGLETPAIFFLEIHKPFSFFVSQTLLIAYPLLVPIFGLENVEIYPALLENRENLEKLIQRIEELAETRRPKNSG